MIETEAGLLPEWGINALILHSTDDSPIESTSSLSRVLPHIREIENPAGTIHGYFYQECEAAGFTLRGSIVETPQDLIHRLREHQEGEGPVALIAVISSPRDLWTSLSVLRWLNKVSSHLTPHQLPRVFLLIHSETHVQILEKLQRHFPIYGILKVTPEENLQYDGSNPPLSSWEAPPPPPGPELSEKEKLYVESRAALLAFRKANAISNDIAISGWIPDPDEGAKLAFHETFTGVAPMDLYGTAAMFFAMEDMGQVSPDEYCFTTPDALTASVSVRTSQGGKLVGLLLMVGKGGSKIPREASLAVAKTISDSFKIQ